MKLNFVIAWIIVILLILSHPWMAFQTQWEIGPNSQQTIHWHQCLTDGAGSADGISIFQQLVGFKIKNNSPFSIMVFSCEK